MITVMLYGHLAKAFGRKYCLDVMSPAEAVRALCTVVPGFKRYILDHSEPGYRVFVGKQERDKDELRDPVAKMETIKIVPVVAGSGATGKIILGVILIVVGYFTSTFGGTYLIQTGIGLVIGGVAEMVFASPKANSSSSSESANNQPSYTFDGAVNTAAQGNPIPICLGGPIRVGSQVLSAGLAVEQI